MPDTQNPKISFWQELKRRKVVRVITLYAAASFVILELVSIIAEPFGLPDWTLKLVFTILLVGLIITIILSWIYDITPGGLIKTKPAGETREKSSEKPASLLAWKIATYLSIIIIIVLVGFQILNKGGQSNLILEQEKSIAVLPFENMSDDSEFDHLGDAMTDEIIMQLYKIHEFEVRSRTSIMQYKNTEKGSPAIGDELNVNFLLEGTTQRYEDKVRIRIQLIHALTDDHIWGEIYDGKWEDIFDIQISVAKQVAEELQTVLSPEEVEKIEYKPTENIEAYNLYLQGRYFGVQYGKENLDKSIRYYKAALDQDPEYALAYSGMASTYTYYAQLGYLPRSDVMLKAKTAAEKALDIDNTLGEAHAELAWAKVYHNFDWKGGEKGLKRALELNPDYAHAHLQYAWLLTFIGRHAEALEESRRVRELDPLSRDRWVSHGRKILYSRDYVRAIEEFQKVLEVFPHSIYARSELAMALYLNGSHDEAIEECLKMDYFDQQLPDASLKIGFIMGSAGKKEKTREILNYQLEISEKEFVRPTNFTILYMVLGEKDRALDWLERAYEQREGWLVLLKVEPMFDPLRSDPRFKAVLDKMDFPD